MGEAKVTSRNDAEPVSALATLLRGELSDAQFSVIHLAHADVEFVPGEYGGSTSTDLEEISKRELDASGLKALHDAGAWKRERFRTDIRVAALRRRFGSDTPFAAFERLLDDLGLLCEGHVGHALAPLIRAYGESSGQRDLPYRSVGTSEIVDLWGYLLVDACLASPRRTASKVFRWIRGAPLAFETRVLLGRLNAGSSFVLSSGIAVDRIPRKSNLLDQWLPTSIHFALTEYLDRSLMRIPCTISPVLFKSTKVTEQRDGIPLVSWNASPDAKTAWKLPAGGVHELTRALSLVCNVAVETPMIWNDYGDHAHFGQRYTNTNIGSGEPTPRTATEITLTAKHLKEAIRLQPLLCDAPASVRTAFEYWLKSKGRRPDTADRLVFLRTALEALFLDDSNRAELTFRLATNGAWYTGRNRAERQRRFDVLKKVYAAASGAVHSGRAQEDGARLLNDGQEICRLAILKRLRSKSSPVWRDVVFGM